MTANPEKRSPGPAVENKPLPSQVLHDVGGAHITDEQARRVLGKPAEVHPDKQTSPGDISRFRHDVVIEPDRNVAGSVEDIGSIGGMERIVSATGGEKAGPVADEVLEQAPKSQIFTPEDDAWIRASPEAVLNEDQKTRKQELLEAEKISRAAGGGVGGDRGGEGNGDGGNHEEEPNPENLRFAEDVRDPDTVPERPEGQPRESRRTLIERLISYIRGRDQSNESYRDFYTKKEIAGAMTRDLVDLTEDLRAVEVTPEVAELKSKEQALLKQLEDSFWEEVRRNLQLEKFSERFQMENGRVPEEADIIAGVQTIERIEVTQEEVAGAIRQELQIKRFQEQQGRSADEPIDEAEIAANIQTISTIEITDEEILNTAENPLMRSWAELSGRIANLTADLLTDQDVIKQLQNIAGPLNEAPPSPEQIMTRLDKDTERKKTIIEALQLQRFTYEFEIREGRLPTSIEIADRAAQIANIKVTNPEISDIEGSRIRFCRELLQTLGTTLAIGLTPESMQQLRDELGREPTNDERRDRAEQVRAERVRNWLQIQRFREEFEVREGTPPTNAQIVAAHDEITDIEITDEQLTEGIRQLNRWQILEAMRADGRFNDTHLQTLIDTRLLPDEWTDRINTIFTERNNHQVSQIERQLKEIQVKIQHAYDEEFGLKKEAGASEAKEALVTPDRPFSECAADLERVSLTDVEEQELRDKLGREPTEAETKGRLGQIKEKAEKEVDMYLKIAWETGLLADARDYLNKEFEKMRDSVNGVHTSQQKIVGEPIGLVRKKHRESVAGNTAPTDLEADGLEVLFISAARIAATRTRVKFSKKDFAGVIKFYVKRGHEKSLGDYLIYSSNKGSSHSHLDGEWNWRKVVAEEQRRVAGREKLWYPSGSGFFYFKENMTADEYVEAIIDHAQHIKNLADEPSRIFQQVEYFRMGLQQNMKNAGIEDEVITAIVAAYSVEAYAYLAERFNRAYDLRNLVAVVSKMNEVHEALKNWTEAPKLRDGMVYLAYMLARDPAYRELMYGGIGPFNQLKDYPEVSMFLTDRGMPQHLAETMVGEMISDVHVSIPGGKIYGEPGNEEQFKKARQILTNRMMKQFVGLHQRQPADYELEALEPTDDDVRAEISRFAVEKNKNLLGLDQPEWVKRRAYVAPTEQLLTRLGNIERMISELAAAYQAAGKQISAEDMENQLAAQIKVSFTPRELEALRLRDIKGRLRKAEELETARLTSNQLAGKTAEEIAAMAITRGSIFGEASVGRQLSPEMLNALYKVILKRGFSVALNQEGRLVASGVCTKEEHALYDKALKQANESVRIFLQLDSLTGEKTKKNGTRYFGRARTGSTESNTGTMPVLTATRESLYELRCRIGLKLYQLEPKEAAKDFGVPLEIITHLRDNTPDTQIIADKPTLFVEAGLKTQEIKTADAIPDEPAEHLTHYAVKTAKQRVEEYNSRLDALARAAYYSGPVSTREERKAAVERAKPILAKKISRESNEYRFFITYVRDSAINQIYTKGWLAQLDDYDIEKLHDPDFLEQLRGNEKKKIKGLREKELDGLVQRMDFRVDGDPAQKYNTPQEMAGLLQESHKRRMRIGEALVKKDAGGNRVFLTVPGEPDRLVTYFTADKSPMSRYMEATYIANQWEIHKKALQGAVYVPATYELYRLKILEGPLSPNLVQRQDVATALKTVSELTAQQLEEAVSALTPEQYQALFSKTEWKVLDMRDKKARLEGKAAVVPSNREKPLTKAQRNSYAKEVEKYKYNNLFEAARRIRDGESKPEEEDIMASLILNVNPDLSRLHQFGFAEQKMEEELNLAACEEVFIDRLDIRTALSIMFSDATTFVRPNKDGALGRVFYPAELALSNPSRWSIRDRWGAIRFLALGNSLTEQEGFVGGFFDYTKLAVRQYPQFHALFQEVTDGPRSFAFAESLSHVGKLNDHYFGYVDGQGNHKPGKTEKATLAAENMLRTYNTVRRLPKDGRFTSSSLMFRPSINKNSEIEFVKDGEKGKIRVTPENIDSVLKEMYENGREPLWWSFKDAETQRSFLGDLLNTLDTDRQITDQAFKQVSANNSAGGAWYLGYTDVTLVDPITGKKLVFNPEAYDPNWGTRRRKGIGRAADLTARHGNYTLDQLRGTQLPVASGRTALVGGRLEYEAQQDMWSILDEVRLNVAYMTPDDKALFPEYADNVRGEMQGPTIREWIITKWTRR